MKAPVPHASVKQVLGICLVAVIDLALSYTLPTGISFGLLAGIIQEVLCLKLNTVNFFLSLHCLLDCSFLSYDLVVPELPQAPLLKFSS